MYMNKPKLTTVFKLIGARSILAKQIRHSLFTPIVPFFVRVTTFWSTQDCGFGGGISIGAGAYYARCTAKH